MNARTEAFKVSYTNLVPYMHVLCIAKPWFFSWRVLRTDHLFARSLHPCVVSIHSLGRRVHTLLHVGLPIINSSISMPLQGRNLASAHQCEVTDVGGANRDSAVVLCSYLYMTGLYLAQGLLCTKADTSKIRSPLHLRSRKRFAVRLWLPASHH